MIQEQNGKEKEKDSSLKRRLGGFESFFVQSHQLGFGLIYMITEIESTFKGEINVDRISSLLMDETMKLMVKRHPILRAVLTEDMWLEITPFNKFTDNKSRNVYKYNLNTSMHKDIYHYASTLMVKSPIPFNVSNKEGLFHSKSKTFTSKEEKNVPNASTIHPLWSLTLIHDTVQNKDYFLLLTHHSIMDADSMLLFLSEYTSILAFLVALSKIYQPATDRNLGLFKDSLGFLLRSIKVLPARNSLDDYVHNHFNIIKCVSYVVSKLSRYTIVGILRKRNIPEGFQDFLKQMQKSLATFTTLTICKDKNATLCRDETIPLCKDENYNNNRDIHKGPHDANNYNTSLVNLDPSFSLMENSEFAVPKRDITAEEYGTFSTLKTSKRSCSILTEVIPSSTFKLLKEKASQEKVTITALLMAALILELDHINYSSHRKNKITINSAPYVLETMCNLRSFLQDQTRSISLLSAPIDLVHAGQDREKAKKKNVGINYDVSKEESSSSSTLATVNNLSLSDYDHGHEHSIDNSENELWELARNYKSRLTKAIESELFIRELELFRLYLWINCLFSFFLNLINLIANFSSNHLISRVKTAALSNLGIIDERINVATISQVFAFSSNESECNSKNMETEHLGFEDGETTGGETEVDTKNFTISYANYMKTNRVYRLGRTHFGITEQGIGHVLFLSSATKHNTLYLTLTSTQPILEYTEVKELMFRLSRRLHHAANGLQPLSIDSNKFERLNEKPSAF